MRNRKRRILRNVGLIVSTDRIRPDTLGTTLSQLSRDGVRRARLLTYAPDEISQASRALGRGSQIAVSVPDAEVKEMGRSMESSSKVCEAIGHMIRSGTVDLVVIGVTPPSGVGADVAWTESLANATRNVHAACLAANATVKVTTSFSLSVLRSSFPPSASLFAQPGPLIPILSHLRATNAPFVIELDPYLAWKNSYYDISLDYATFGGEGKPPVFVDYGAAYWNLYDAMVDAVRWALYQQNYVDLDLVVGSVGWPSGSAYSGSPGANPQQAANFNSRLARHLNCSTSAVPGARVDADGCLSEAVAFIYQAADEVNNGEDLKWGVCAYPSGEPKYSLATGSVLISTLEKKPTPAIDPPATASSRPFLIVASALVLLFAYTFFRRKRPNGLFRKHTADSVATIIRSSRHAAQENLQAARASTLNHHQKTFSTRFFATGLANKPINLRAIAESGSTDLDSSDSESVTTSRLLPSSSSSCDQYQQQLVASSL